MTSTSRDYFPQRRRLPVTRPAADAPTMAQAVWAVVLLDVQLLARPAEPQSTPPTK